MPYAEIARKYKHVLPHYRAVRYISQHKKEGHVGKRPAGEAAPNPGTLTEIKQERHRLSVDERIDEMYDLAIDMVKAAKKTGDYKTAAICLKEANSATALMGKVTGDKDDDKPGIDRAVELMRARNDARK